MKILTCGSIAYDLLLQYDGSFPDAIDPMHIDELSVAYVTPRFARHHGGTGANIAWNLRLLNQEPLLVGTVGNDGGTYTALLEERGISTKRVEVQREHATSTAIVATDSREHQITFFHPGADAYGTFPDISEERDDLAYAIISPRDAKVMLQAAEWCRKFAVPYLFDPGQQTSAFSEDELLRAIQGSAGLVANAYEWGLISKRTSFSVDQLLEHVKVFILTQGEDGCTVYTPKGATVLSACKPESVVNPTGAGDAFRAGLLTGLAAKWPLPQAARLGCSVASFVVEQEGTLLDSLDINDVLGRAETTYGEALPALP
ncbi:MAG: carbohydrate kinase family protein [Candidatus Peribacteraceae bacterium]|nr:carbohydrate kinase family protein [Candidatus Peribacteraceae bacterium]